jgi:hypothetical protein
MMATETTQRDDEFTGISITYDNRDEAQALYETIDAMCEAVSFTETIPGTEKSKLIQFSVEFCDDYGVAHDAVDVVLGSRMADDRNRELFIEVNGILTETIVYDAQMAIAGRAA